MRYACDLACGFQVAYRRSGLCDGDIQIRGDPAVTGYKLPPQDSDGTEIARLDIGLEEDVQEHLECDRIGFEPAPLQDVPVELDP